MKIVAILLATMGMMTFGWIAAVFLQTSRPTASSQWIADAYALKTAAAQKIEGKKIVIVAGSTALFGIDSKKLEETYRLPVVNFGVNAGLLLPYVLLKSQSVLKRGDIVILPLEYHFYTYDGIPNAQMIDQIWSRDPSFFWKLSWKERLSMLWMTPISRLVDGFLAQGGSPMMCGPYGYKNLDERGDQTHTSEEEAKQWATDWEGLKKELPRRYGAVGNVDSLGWKWLRRYVAWAAQNGICLIVTPSTMMYDDSYWKDPEERRFYEGLKARIEALGVPFIGNPYSTMYGREMYFNTDFHLIDTGREVWTQQLINDLGSDISKWCIHG
ncbi:hypothetical protein [Sulfuricurvum sp.]|uniref:hypothetical protein n=1 Tax=Sulfuricurvum sp. TaxID=2025608 RepID=UPI0026252F24|nr:hypothetical protein [Sulfuricurvum sp.]MDD2266026.1 hypothetical protein [Sulfuricurvum sp.]MDD2783038.1 hypothetical protein [Sulfuricurvum sp.]